MDWKKIKLVAAILKAIQPIIWSIVDDILDAKEPDSDGGTAITQKERQEIIIEHLLDLPSKIEPILKDL